MKTNFTKIKKKYFFRYASEMYENKKREKRRQTFLRLITCKIQENLISILKSQHVKRKKTLKTSKGILISSQKKKKEFFEELKIEENLDFRKRQLEVMFYYTKWKINVALNKQRETSYILEKLKRILYDVMYTVFSALKVNII